MLWTYMSSVEMGIILREVSRLVWPPLTLFNVCYIRVLLDMFYDVSLPDIKVDCHNWICCKSTTWIHEHKVEVVWSLKTPKLIPISDWLGNSVISVVHCIVICSYIPYNLCSWRCMCYVFFLFHIGRIQAKGSLDH
jgi:hypothetical protein